MNIRRLILPSALILLLAGAFAGAQTITKALQLSQDATGAFGIDTNNGVYFPGHLLSPTGGQNPAPTVAGTGTPTIAGTDTAGLVTMGTSATTGTVTFGRAYVSVPSCVVSWQGPITTTTPMAYTIVTTSIAMTQGSTSGNKINYICMSAS